MEASVLKRKFFDLPSKFYYAFENCIPQSVKARPDFTPINSASDYPLARNNNSGGGRQFNSVYGRQQAQNVSGINSGSNANNNNNPFRGGNDDAGEAEKKSKFSGGGASVAIGGSSHAMSYKDMWKMRENEENKERERQEREQQEKEQE